MRGTMELRRLRRVTQLRLVLVCARPHPAATVPLPARRLRVFPVPPATTAQETAHSRPLAHAPPAMRAVVGPAPRRERSARQAFSALARPRSLPRVRVRRARSALRGLKQVRGLHALRQAATAWEARRPPLRAHAPPGTIAPLAHVRAARVFSCGVNDCVCVTVRFLLAISHAYDACCCICLVMVCGVCTVCAKVGLAEWLPGLMGPCERCIDGFVVCSIDFVLAIIRVCDLPSTILLTGQCLSIDRVGVCAMLKLSRPQQRPREYRVLRAPRVQAVQVHPPRVRVRRGLHA